MTQDEIRSKIEELKELKFMKAELDDMITSIEDSLKAELTAQKTNQMIVGPFKMTWNPVVSSRIDASALKNAMPDIAERFTKTSISRRFTIS